MEAFYVKRKKHKTPNIMQRPRQMQRLLFLLLGQLLTFASCDTTPGPKHERRPGGKIICSKHSLCYIIADAGNENGVN